MRLEVEPGDRVATICPNTYVHLEPFYAAPQLGSILVSMTDRLTANDFVYLATHSGSKLLMVHQDYADATDIVQNEIR